MMWVLVVNGLVYLMWIYLHGEWRGLVPGRGDARDAWQNDEVLPVPAARSSSPGQAQALQKLAYFSLPLVAALVVVSGIAIWKPVQFAPLTNLLGGYVWARYWHFVSMLAVVVLAVGNVFMVFAVDPYSFALDDHGRLRSDTVTRGAQRATVPESAAPTNDRVGAGTGRGCMSIDRRRFLALGGVAASGVSARRATRRVRPARAVC
jgi:hypothetical protein